MMKNIILAGMIVAGIAVVFTANKKPEEKIEQPSVADLRKVAPKSGDSKVVFEDDYDGNFSSAKKKKGKKIVEQSDSDPEIVEDDGDEAWNDKDEGSVEEVEDFSEEESDEGHGHSHQQKPKSKASLKPTKHDSRARGNS